MQMVAPQYLFENETEVTYIDYEMKIDEIKTLFPNSIAIQTISDHDFYMRDQLSKWKILAKDYEGEQYIYNNVYRPYIT
jgi:hypothetical protein